MRRKKHVLSAASIAITLSAAIYFGARLARPPAETPPDSPLPATVAPVVNKAAQAAAVEARAVAPDNSFRELRMCVYAWRELAIAEHLMDCSFYEDKPEYQKALAECMAGPMDAHNRRTAAKATLAHCEEGNLGQRYFEATKAAANRGDADAQLCYLGGDFFRTEGAEIFTDAERAEYREVAPGYVDAAFKRGDWRIVKLMNKRHFHPDGAVVAYLEGIGDRETQYKMTRLLRLGASGTYARHLDSDLEGMKHPDLVPEAALPPEAVREGDAWAQETYNNYFAGVPGLTEEPQVCPGDK